MKALRENFLFILSELFGCEPARCDCPSCLGFIDNESVQKKISNASSSPDKKHFISSVSGENSDKALLDISDLIDG